jgi:hypothetical protein
MLPGALRGAVHYLVIALLCATSACSRNTPAAEARRLDGVARQVRADIGKNMDMGAAKALMAGKFRASPVNVRHGGPCSAMYSIEGKAFEYGTRQVLMVFIDCVDNKVTRVETSIAGVGL